MRQIHDQQYSRFDPKERLNLTISALSRGDEIEANRLWQTCPRHTYEAYDFEYTLSVDALFMLSAIFFEKCIFHYNLIKRADLFMISFEEDLEFEEKNNLNDFANQTRKLIELSNQAQKIHTSQLKGLFEGFKQFCSSAGLDNESILKTSPIKDCCHDIDILLTCYIEIDMQYASQIKEFFLEHWHF